MEIKHPYASDAIKLLECPIVPVRKITLIFDGKGWVNFKGRHPETLEPLDLIN